MSKQMFIQESRGKERINRDEIRVKRKTHGILARIYVQYSILQKLRIRIIYLYAYVFVCFHDCSQETRTSSWLPPADVWCSDLPYGWEQAVDSERRPYYIK